MRTSYRAHDACELAVVLGSRAAERRVRLERGRVQSQRLVANLSESRGDGLTTLGGFGSECPEK